jgi:hypothetical protein
MAEECVERQLPAILRADLVGCPRLMGQGRAARRILKRDSGAPTDIPAFCRLTGHRLPHEKPEQAAHWIMAKE